MWRQSASADRGTTLIAFPATYSCASHKNGYVACNITVLRARLRVSRQTRRPAQGAVVERRWHVPADEATREGALRMASSRRWCYLPEPGATIDAAGRHRLAASDENGAPDFSVVNVVAGA